MDPHQKEFGNWEQIVQGLTMLYSTSLLLTAQISYSEKENPHRSLILNQLCITSLYHTMFQKINNDEDLCEELKQLDFNSPKVYNMGRNQFSEFAFTHNQKYVIKKINASSYLYFKKILHQYYFKIVQDQNPLLAKTYGVYCLEDQKNKVYFILMENLFYYLTLQQSQILSIYDLKGAITNRTSKDFDKLYSEQQEQISQGIYTLLLKGKDQDFIKIDFFRDFDMQLKQLIMEKLSQETYILGEAKAMDYSLMIITGYLKQPIKQEDCQRFIVINENIGITIGIIDYFQEYNSSKKLEQKFKTFFSRNKQENQISCVDSETYRMRFKQYFLQLFQL